MFFLLNDAVLNLELHNVTLPLVARQFSEIDLGRVLKLGCELFAEEPRLQHQRVERARRLCALIVSKAPEANAALFVGPAQGCKPDQVAARLAYLDMAVLAQLHRDQQAGRLTPAIADRLVWARAA